MITLPEGTIEFLNNRFAYQTEVQRARALDEAREKRVRRAERYAYLKFWTDLADDQEYLAENGYFIPNWGKDSVDVGQP